MKNLKKFGALLLALVLVMSLSVTAFATANLGGSEPGVAGTWTTADTKVPQDDNVNIKKEIIAFNPNGTTVHTPELTYTYTVTPATITDQTVTDETTNHTSNTAVVAPVNPGITTGLVVTGTAAGTAGDASSAVGTLVFTNDTTTWTTAVGGDTNEYDINLDFSGVTFTHPGVYRYQIAESINYSDYDDAAMVDGAHDTLYLDVYVDGENQIYGYVCMNANDSVTPSTEKINGFVTGASTDNADKYYTYDLVLTKDVVGDNYASMNTAFPFTVYFYNNATYLSTFKIDQSAGTGSTGLNSDAATLTLAAYDPSNATNFDALSGIALVKDGNTTENTTVGDITITGIPAGVDVEVYETNVATGVTYSAETEVTGVSQGTDNPVISHAAPSSAAKQIGTRADWESTKVTVDTTAVTATAAQSVDITNTLILISPTGYIARIAPYALILMFGVGLFIFAAARRRKEEEAAA